MFRNLVEKNRSYRRFIQNHKMPENVLMELIDLARLTPSGANRQPLKYYPSCNPETNVRIFPYLSWAGYLKDWPGPEEGERPSAYIVILGDKSICESFGCDHGIAAQTILLGAAEKGYGGCIIGSIQRDGLCKEFKIPEHLEILLVIALGKPYEKVVLETVGADGNIKYWRDEKGVHHVPKRDLDELILNI